MKLGPDEAREEINYAYSLDFTDLEAMSSEAMAICADGCVVEPDGQCEHGYQSPLLVRNLI